MAYAMALGMGLPLVDSKTGGEILALLHESVDNYGQTMVMVTHEARAAAAATRWRTTPWGTCG